MRTRTRVPVARPLLPTFEDVAPYLRQIDRSRRYGNHGPLSRRFEDRLAAAFGSDDPECVMVLPSGTAALTAVLAALRLPGATACVLPAWTFAATAHAVVNAGLQPWFADVDPIEGVLRPETVRSLVDRTSIPVAAVAVVAPFGAPIDIDAWIVFRRETGIPVIVDAAAGFDTVRASSVPTIVSLHATKVLGVGEGGCIVWNDEHAVRDIRIRANFGFNAKRESVVAGFNGKVDEYTAAVGLAALDRWPQTRACFARVGDAYRTAFAGSPVTFQAGYATRWVSATAVARFPEGMRDEAQRALAECGVETRRWWGNGAHAHRAFSAFPSTPLPNTAALAANTLGLPCAPDLSTETIGQIAAVARAVLTASGAKARKPRGGANRSAASHSRFPALENPMLTTETLP